MSLFTKTDLLAAIPDAHILLATDDTAIGEVDEDVLESILADATGFIAGYLDQAGIEIPDPAPARLKHIAVKYAEYALHRRRNNIAQAGRVYEEWIKPAMTWLDRIATGAATLTPVAPGETVGGIVSEPSRMSTGGRLMI